MKKLLRLIVPVVLSAVILPNVVLGAGEWRSYHPTELILTETTPIYDELFSNKKIAEVAPQTVKVKASQLPGWYKIETWLGEKWICPSNALSHESNFKARKLQLNDTIYLYDEPFTNKKSLMALAPQIIEAIDEAGNFYKINTWLGDKWIMRPSIEEIDKITDITDVKKTNEKIILTAKTKMYKTPFTASKVLGELAPQSVQAFEKLEIPFENWYHIKSDWVGEAWVKVDLVTTK